jgi:hypothetical protein
VHVWWRVIQRVDPNLESVLADQRRHRVLLLPKPLGYSKTGARSDVQIWNCLEKENHPGVQRQGRGVLQAFCKAPAWLDDSWTTTPRRCFRSGLPQRWSRVCS